MSQLHLALACDVSARHLSFLESGRAKPSRDMVLKLAGGMLLPLSARNTLLQSAGFAAVFPASPLDSEALIPFRAILDDMIARHAPNPALLVDRYWNILDTNATARALLGAMQPESGESNVIRMLTDNPNAPQLFANYSDVLAEITARMQLEALEAGDDPVLEALLADLHAASAQHPPADPDAVRRPLMPLILNVPGIQLSFLTTIAHFGTSQDVTIRDLRLELLFPADDQTREAMVALAASIQT